MKILFIIILLLGLVVFGIILFVVYRLTNPIGKVSKLKDLEAIPIQQARLYQDVKKLTSIRPYRHSGNLEGMQKTVNFLKEAFSEAGYEPILQSFKTPDGNEYQNVIAFYGDTALPRLVVGAHYDVCGEQEGADDNATAVAGLLEIARVLKEKQPKLAYCIELVGYANEEPPYFRSKYMGSAIHAQSLKQQAIPVKAMVCLEMLGYYSDEPNSQTLPLPFLTYLYSSTANFIAVVGKWEQVSIVKTVKKYMTMACEVPVYSINSPDMVRGIDFSDHRNYWAEGFQAVMITDTSFFRNPNYHKTTDTIETIDFQRMTEVVRGAYWAIINL